jgi:transposase
VAGLDGFWIHRALEKEGIQIHVVDPASIMTSRRRRRAKTDRIDGEALVRALMAYHRGEPRVCAMLQVPRREEEDRCQGTRELKTLTAERVRMVNRIKGLLFAQGVSGYAPLRRDRRAKLEQLRTGDGRPLPQYLKWQIVREIDRLELLLEQIKAVKAERDDMLAAAKEAAILNPAEGLFRSFSNRRQIAAYGGLAPTPWQSGTVDREQGVSKSGNPRLRTTMLQLAWLWLRQPGSALSRWFHERVHSNSRARKIMIVALARKLLVAF